MIVKKILQSNRLTYYLIQQIRRIQYIMVPYIIYLLQFNIKRFVRVSGLNRKSPYEKLKNLKNMHKGERCFIVATGPSLEIEDLEKLNNEITFSMNSICLAFCDTDWRPTYYGIQGIEVYKKLKQYMDIINVECKFIGDTIDLPEPASNEYIFPLHLLNHSMDHKKYGSKFSNDSFAAVYDGYTITYSLIQIAVYMGFKEIYLLGVDCNYSSDLNHHFKEYGLVDRTYRSAAERMMSAYMEAKTFADQNNIKIFNATRGGMLEIFERVDLDDVLIADKRKRKISG